MGFLYFCIGFAVAWFIFQVLKGILIINSFAQLEQQFLLAAASFEQYKHHAIKIVEIAYSAHEGDEEKKAECGRITSGINEKFIALGDLWVSGFQERMPYKLQYNDWQSALKYVNKLFKKDGSN